MSGKVEIRECKPCTDDKFIKVIQYLDERELRKLENWESDSAEIIATLSLQDAMLLLKHLKEKLGAA